MSIKSIDYNLKVPKPEIYLATPSRIIIGKLNKHTYNEDRIKKLRDISQFSFNIPIELDVNGQLVSHPLLSRVKQNYTIRLDYNGETEWYKIVKINRTSDDQKEELLVTCYSLATELNQKKILNLDEQSQNCTQMLTIALNNTKWTIANIDPSFDIMYRDFSVTTKTALEFILNDIVTTFNDGTGTVAIFDTVNRTVSIQKEINTGNDLGLKIKHQHYMSSVDQETNDDMLCTRLYCFGYQGLDITRTNPSGQQFVDDFSYFLAPYTTDTNGNVLISSDYFSDSLSQAVINYNNLLASKAPVNDTAETGTTSTTLVMTNHGLSTGDYIKNTTRNASSEVTVVDANTLTLTTSITNQVVGDSILKYGSNTFGKLLYQLEDLQATLTQQQSDLNNLQTQKLVILDQLAIQTKANTMDSFVNTISNASYTRTLSNLNTVEYYVGMAYVTDTASTTVTLNGSTIALATNTWTVLGKVTGSTSYNIGINTTASNVTAKTMIVKITDTEYTTSSNDSTIIDTYCDDNKQIQINTKQTDINTTNTNITNKQTDITNMRNSLSYSANFTTAQLDELTDYIYEDEYNDENIVDDEDLYNIGLQQLAQRKMPQILYKTDIVDFLQSVDQQFNWKKLNLGDMVEIIHPKLNIDAKVKILEIDHNFEQASIQLTIGDNKEVLSKKDRVIKQLYKSLSSTRQFSRKKQFWDVTKLNFDNRNDRISTTPNDPVLASDGTAIDHTVNSNGSVDITFEWSYNDYNTTKANADNIDGFFVYIYSSDKDGRYVIGSTNDNVDIRTMKSEDRYVVLLGVAANKYYTFAVQTFRIVDQDISTDGILKSNIIQSSVNAENPYQPLTNPAYTGDWQGTIGGIAYDEINKSSVTVIVADGSTTQNTKLANFVVPVGSTSAQTIINQAINSLPSGGGKVVLLDGTYIIDENIVLNDNTSLEGQGLSTIIKIKDNLSGLSELVMFASSNLGMTNIVNVNISIKNLLSDGNRATVTSFPTYGIKTGNGVKRLFISGVYFNNFNNSGLLLSGISYSNIVNNFFSGNNNVAIEILSSSNNVISNNNIDNTNTNNTVTDNIVLSSGSNNNTVSNNSANRGNGVHLVNSNDNVIVGNSFNNAASNGGQDGIVLEQVSNHNTINGNTLTDNRYGIQMNNCSYNSISGNTIRNNYQDGIYLTTATDNSISSNILSDNSRTTNNTYNHISLTTSSSNNNVQSNICREGVSTNATKYGIAILTTNCNANIVANNDLINSGVTGSFSDGGTGTVTTSANRL